MITISENEGMSIQKVLAELSRDPLSEEITALSAATCALAERVVPILVR